MTQNYIGGQAVIEGVLMKGKDHFAVAVRTPSGTIKVKKEPFASKTHSSKFFRLPVIRGIVILFEMMAVGFRALNWSANQQLEVEEDMSWFEITVSVILSLIFGIGLFIVAPYWVSSLVHGQETVRFQILDGIFRFTIFLIYLLLLSFIPDVKRLFQYHGAEHKTVHCHESGMPLSVKNVKKCPTEHVRCGTSLIFLVVALSIVLFSFVRTPVWWINILARIVLVPFLGGISYEFMRFSASRPNSKLLWWLSRPGLWFQSITALEPDSRQIEVAIASLKAVR